MTATDWASGAPRTGEYAEVNGLNLYYETHGFGRPMILLHGGLGSGEMFGPIMPALAERHPQRRVLLLQPGHGRLHDQPAAAEQVERAQFAGDQQRVP